MHFIAMEFLEVNTWFIVDLCRKGNDSVLMLYVFGISQAILFRHISCWRIELACTDSALLDTKICLSLKFFRLFPWFSRLDGIYEEPYSVPLMTCQCMSIVYGTLEWLHMLAWSLASVQLLNWKHICYPSLSLKCPTRVLSEEPMQYRI